MRQRISITFLLISAALSFSTLSASAQEKIFVAVAANYIQAFSELSERYEEKTNVKIQATFASTGSLYNQIKSGAPYDLFLAADETRPQLLQEEGLCDKPFIYARGRVILWSANSDFCKSPDWKDAMKNCNGRIAVANPVTAPYGTAALEAIRKAGLEDLLKDRFVTAQTVAQSFQYAATEAVDAGFCALSAVGSETGQRGCYYLVPEADPVVQAACVLRRTGSREAVDQFAAFLVSQEAAEIKKRFGYE